MPKQLKDVGSVVELGHWMQSRGFIVSEHPNFGGVHPVHSKTSLHYVDQAMDVNHNFHSDDDAREWPNETEALKWLFKRIVDASKKHAWPLDEMFFDGLGYLKETPTTNHPIGGHDGHLHVAFQQKKW